MCWSSVQSEKTSKLSRSKGHPKAGSIILMNLLHLKQEGGSLVLFSTTYPSFAVFVVLEEKGAVEGMEPGCPVVCDISADDFTCGIPDAAEPG